jgi:Bifunctional DNA primase/polymerase, N-terminal
MNDTTLGHALACAARGWPVFPCQPGQKIPATRHGHLDATTDQQRITVWFGGLDRWNLAVATGAPGPDVLDIDQHGPKGSGFGALARLRAAGLLDGAAAYVRTPSGGLHAYFTGTRQRNGHLPAHHLDFRSAGGYVLVPPSVVGGRPYKPIHTPNGHGRLDWETVTRLLEPDRQQASAHRQAEHAAAVADEGIGHLARWVAAQPEGNRNHGLFWAANRVLEADPAADLSPLAAAAREAGLGDREITRTLNSARRTTRQGRPTAPGHQAEGVS